MLYLLFVISGPGSGILKILAWIGNPKVFQLNIFFSCQPAAWHYFLSQEQEKKDFERKNLILVKLRQYEVHLRNECSEVSPMKIGKEKPIKQKTNTVPKKSHQSITLKLKQPTKAKKNTNEKKWLRIHTK